MKILTSNSIRKLSPTKYVENPNKQPILQWIRNLCTIMAMTPPKIPPIEQTKMSFDRSTWKIWLDILEKTIAKTVEENPTVKDRAFEWRWPKNPQNNPNITNSNPISIGNPIIVWNPSKKKLFNFFLIQSFFYLQNCLLQNIFHSKATSFSESDLQSNYNH